MGIDLTQIIVSFLAILPVLYEIKKNKAISDNNHNEQLQLAQENDSRLNKRLTVLEKQMEANNLKTARIDLHRALQHSADDIPAVLELSRDYFLNYHGNADLGRKWLAWYKKYHVQEWADTHSEDITNLVESARHVVN